MRSNFTKRQIYYLIHQSVNYMEFEFASPSRKPDNTPIYVQTPSKIMTAATPKKRVARAQGRPDADGLVGREALLEAAKEELRATPPESLTLAAIAARAGVHPALIRYYFGNKDQLLREVVRDLVEQSQEAIRSTMESNARLEQKLSSRLHSMISLIQANPHFHRLVLDKIYGQGSEGDDEDLLGRITTRGMRLTTSLLHDHPAHSLRPIDPRFLHIAIIGLTEFFAAAKPLLHELFGEGADVDAIKSRYIEFATELILHGISSKPAHPQDPTGPDD